MIFLLIIPIVGALFCLGLLIYAIVKFTQSSISNSVNGVEVICTIKDVKGIKVKDAKRNAVYDKHIELKCEFEYEGKKHESILRVFNEIDESKFKVGNKIKCKYNTKTNELVDELNFKGKDNQKFWYALIIGIVFFIYSFIYVNNQSSVNQAIIILLGCAFWYSVIFVFYDSYYAKGKEKYIKLKGHVIDYHIEYKIDDYGSWNYYCPEISFNYNGEKKKYLSSRISVRKLYNIGQEVDVFYNPETDKIYEKGNNKMAYIFMAIPPILGLIALIQHLLK